MRNFRLWVGRLIPLALLALSGCGVATGHYFGRGRSLGTAIATYSARSKHGVGSSSYTSEDYGGTLQANAGLGFAVGTLLGTTHLKLTRPANGATGEETARNLHVYVDLVGTGPSMLGFAFDTGVDLVGLNEEVMRKLYGGDLEDTYIAIDFLLRVFVRFSQHIRLSLGGGYRLGYFASEDADNFAAVTGFDWQATNWLVLRVEGTAGLGENHFSEQTLHAGMVIWIH